MQAFRNGKPIVAMILVAGAVAAGASALAVEPTEGGSTYTPALLRSVLALKPDRAAGEALYEPCAACHQSTGWGVRDGTVPQIAGQHYRYLLKQILEFRSGERAEPRMHHFANAPELASEQAIANLSNYVVSLPPTPRPTTGDGSDLERGASLYNDLCVICHSEDAGGSAILGIPVLAGQHYPYLARQLRWIAEGTRHNVNDYLVWLFAELPESDRAALADYISRLEHPAREAAD